MVGSAPTLPTMWRTTVHRPLRKRNGLTAIINQITRFARGSSNGGPKPGGLRSAFPFQEARWPSTG
jgi:hypothetical protein